MPRLAASRTRPPPGDAAGTQPGLFPGHDFHGTMIVAVAVMRMMQRSPHQIPPRGRKANAPSLRKHPDDLPTDIAGLRVRRSLVAAMEQQMWFFGCDAACANGNLLVRYGFHRHRPEDCRGKSSRYQFLWRRAAGSTVAGPGLPDARVDLHGWCAGAHHCKEAAQGGFLYVRGGNRVGWYNAPQPPAPAEYDDDPRARHSFRLLGRHPEPGFRRNAALFLAWIEEYESWIEMTCGPDYRRRCFQRAPLPWLTPAEGRAWLARYRQISLAAAADHPPSC